MIINNEVIDILKKHFVFDNTFDLLKYDLHMDVLYEELKLLRHSCYKLNYRFIFLHYDTEYYISTDYPGLTIINLQKILESLDIPNYFCLILTQQELQPMCDRAKEYFAPNDSCSIAVIKNYLHTPLYTLATDFSLTLNQENIIKKYISLNGAGRFHRRVLFALLKFKNLINFGWVSYLGKR
jgi:hypothetical protein